MCVQFRYVEVLREKTSAMLQCQTAGKVGEQENLWAFCEDCAIYSGKLKVY